VYTLEGFRIGNRVCSVDSLCKRDFQVKRIDFRSRKPFFNVTNFISLHLPTFIEQESENQDMCLAIPAKVVNRKEDKAEVDFGEGVLREVNVTLVEAKVGDYVLVHAGYAIQVLDEKEALETLQLWNEILGAEAVTGQR
jgi:hydrogenase expression/formation protein HypC